MGFTIDGGFLLGVLIGVGGTLLYQSSTGHRHAHEAFETRRPRRQLKARRA